MEKWKNILGFDGNYQISNYGNVKSFINNIILKPSIASKRNNKQGYKVVNLKGKLYYIHRLVAEAFIPNIANKPQINHIDGNKLNNKVDNLEWCTNSENIKHAYKIGLKEYKEEKISLKQKEWHREFGKKYAATKENNIFKEKWFRDKYKDKILKYKKVEQLDKNGNVIKEWNSIIEASRKLNIDQSSISKCCREKRKTAGGYNWKYKKLERTRKK